MTPATLQPASSPAITAKEAATAVPSNYDLAAARLLQADMRNMDAFTKLIPELVRLYGKPDVEKALQQLLRIGQELSTTCLSAMNIVNGRTPQPLPQHLAAPNPYPMPNIDAAEAMLAAAKQSATSQSNGTPKQQ